MVGIEKAWRDHLSASGIPFSFFYWIGTSITRAATNKSSLNFAALHLSFAANSAPLLTCAGPFFRAISAYVHTIPPPRVTSINAAKGGVFFVA